jgi:hypothetical protein
MTKRDPVITCSADDLPTDDPSPGDYVEIDGDVAVIEEVLGGRARINYAVKKHGADARVETYGTEELGDPSRGDVIRVDGERGIVEEILGGQARVNLSVED